MKRKMSIEERLARRPGPKVRPPSKAILEWSQPLCPQFGELNPGKSESPLPRRGAPLGNRNRWLHGAYSAERRALFAEIRAHLRLGRELLRQFRALAPVAAGSRTGVGHMLPPPDVVRGDYNGGRP